MPKRTQSAVYYHVSAIPSALQYKLGTALKLARWPSFNVVKFSNDNASVSLLNYPSFRETGHPALMQSVTVDLEEKTTCLRTYNPRTAPVLHRKELFVREDDEDYPVFRDLTELEEQEGLLDKPPGFSHLWQERLTERGYKVIGNTLMKNVEKQDG